MPTSRYVELTQMPAADLERLFVGGSRPDAANLVGFEWRGFNTPRWAALLGIRRFIKGFFRSGKGAQVEGFNISVRQGAAEDLWQHVPNPEFPKRFGFYDVYPVRKDERDHAYPNALLLNYGSSTRNAFFRPERVLRDYLVVPDPLNPDILLGKAYLALGPVRVPSNFFVLERMRPFAWSA